MQTGIRLSRSLLIIGLVLLGMALAVGGGVRLSDVWNVTHASRIWGVPRIPFDPELQSGSGHDFHHVEIIEVEHPKRMEINRSDSVRISLAQEEPGAWFVVQQDILETDDFLIVSSAPIPAGTPEAPLRAAFGPKYTGFARANLVGTAFEIEAATSSEQPIDQKMITWEWNILSDKPGRQVINAIIEVKWQPEDGGQPIERQVWRQRLDMPVDKPFIPTSVFSVLSSFSSVLGLALSFPWAYEKVRRWGKGRLPSIDQLAEARENLLLIQERKSEYVEETDIPLQLIKDERRLLKRIEQLERQLWNQGNPQATSKNE